MVSSRKSQTTPQYVKKYLIYMFQYVLLLPAASDKQMMNAAIIIISQYELWK